MLKNLKWPLRLLAGIFGVLLLAWLIRRTGLNSLRQSIAALGWRISLVIALGGAAHLIKTAAWRITMLDDKRHVSYLRMLALRLGSEAVGQIGILGQAVGETLRCSFLSSTMPLASGIASVALDRALFVITGTTVSVGGLLAVLAVLPLPHKMSVWATVLALALLVFILVVALAFRQRWAVFSGPTRLLARVPHFRHRLEASFALIESVENRLLDFYHHTPGAFWASFALNIGWHAAAIGEVYLTLHLMGIKCTTFAALAIEALTKVINTIGSFSPGNLGIYEGGNMLVGKLFGLTAAAGLTLALARRVRALFWAAVGGICLIALSKSRKESSEVHMTTHQANDSTATSQGQVAIILANSAHSGNFDPALAFVGALPLLLRVILGAKKAGAARIVVLEDATAGESLRGRLAATGRLPKCVEWVRLSRAKESLASAIGRLAAEANGNLILISGDRTYHPSLQRQAAEWNGESGALAFVTDGQLTGIYALTPLTAIWLSQHCSVNARTVEDLHAALSSGYSTECETVSEDKWQLIQNPQDRLLAERKLDRWLVKPTDGIFATANRRVSIPISRQLIKFPITPNMVSLFTLGVSFAAGWYYALGGYWYVLVGALLSLFASILDGSDGEVARLKLQESDFGCWLETICDYLYYLFIYAGMTVGLARSSGNRGYFVWGGMLLVGAVLSFLVTGFQRQRLTAGRPEQLLTIWQTKATNRKSPGLLNLAGRIEFVIRRCFMPYALLFFAVFNITQVAFIIAAVGANIVWMVALYSHFSFTAMPSSTLASAPESAS